MKLESIYLDKISLKNYWWTTPGLGLQAHADPPKVDDLQAFGMERVWVRPVE